MPYNKSILLEKLKFRDLDFLIFNNEIIEKVFNNEIVFTLLNLSKNEILDFTSFFISAMSATGLDEFDMQNSELILVDKDIMFKKIDDFKILWKLNIEIEKYINGEIQYVYEVNTNPDKQNYSSEISFIVETTNSFIYFFTGHFNY